MEDELFEDKNKPYKKRKLHDLLDKYGTIEELEQHGSVEDNFDYMFAGQRELLDEVLEERRENTGLKAENENYDEAENLTEKRQKTAVNLQKKLLEDDEQEKQKSGANDTLPATSRSSLDDEDMAKNAAKHPMFKTPNEDDFQYDNQLTARQRETAFRTGKKIRLHVDENLKEDKDWDWWCDEDNGIRSVKQYSPIIEKYAKQYDVDADLVKAVMFTENSCGHYYGGNALMDYIGISKSQRPMNIRGDIWENFQGKHYDTYNVEQNIELGTALLKQIYNSLDNPTPDRVITLWNSIGRNTISSFGYKGKHAYDRKPWKKR